ncbi:uncharacterized protein CIMG_13355 [Coccidioides immitis RS]|uniref:Uncharacterized protein n=2 Tax=Coccidioides TaxID=5500 RepID=A0A0D8JVJ7_COCIM|nr:uncharacterized protein CIMG_13355 [Coccidioides immitis RS]EFW16945.1 hypothetical protein CPSG_06213 [Coccidioides posadasii str. Silveira]KJF60966.1 hypothetical protein CIMG_13355 [Coccidioides immitis RS]
MPPEARSHIIHPSNRCRLLFDTDPQVEYPRSSCFSLAAEHRVHKEPTDVEAKCVMTESERKGAAQLGRLIDGY